MIIAITGSSGFVGSSIAKLALHDGHNVRFLDRPLFILGKKISEQWLQDVDLLVHCAHDRSDSSATVRGTKVLLEQAQKAGVKNTVFISSLNVAAPSEYGVTKKRAEKTAKDAKAKIIRPGLIYSKAPRGVLGKIVALAKFTPVLPMISGAEQYTCHIDDLYQAVLAAPRATGVIVAAGENPTTLPRIIRRLVGRRLFITIPYVIMYGVVQVASVIPFIGLSTDNLIGLNHRPQTDFSETRRLKLRFREFGC